MLRYLKLKIALWRPNVVSMLRQLAQHWHNVGMGIDVGPTLYKCYTCPTLPDWTSVEPGNAIRVAASVDLDMWPRFTDGYHVPPWSEKVYITFFSIFVPVEGGGPRVVVSTAAFHARVRGLVPGLGGLKETKKFLPHPRVKVSIVGSLRDREVACSASDCQGLNFESCVWRTVSSQSSHHPQEVFLGQFSLYVHKGGLKPYSFHFVPV